MNIRHSAGRLTADTVEANWQTLIQVIEDLRSATAFEKIMSIVCRGARQLCDADGITFVRRDGDLCHYIEEDAIGPLWKGKRFPMSACISGWCMLNGITAVIPDIYEDPRIPHDAYRPTFVKTLIMVPVRVSDPLAAIGAYWADARIHDTHTIRILETLAQSTSTAIVTAKSHEMLTKAPITS